VVGTSYFAGETLQGAAIGQITLATIAEIEIDEFPAPAIAQTRPELLNPFSKLFEPRNGCLPESISLRLEVRVKSAGSHPGLLCETIDSRSAESRPAESATRSPQDLRPALVFLTYSMCHETHFS
jgi:hypothetical protein